MQRNLVRRGSSHIGKHGIISRVVASSAWTMACLRLFQLTQGASSAAAGLFQRLLQQFKPVGPALIDNGLNA